MLATGDKLKIYVESSLMCNETPMDLSFEPPMDTVCRKFSYKLYMPLLKSLIILLREESE